MTEAILSLALLILLAKVLEEVATRLRQPPLLGDVLAGLLLGPLVFRVVEPGREIELFITIGIFFFFFLVGLEEIDLAGFLAATLAFFVVGKYLGGFLAAKTVRLEAPLASASGLMVKGSLEIALLLSLLELGIIDQRYFSLLIFTTF